ncbi:MAG: SWIM zinc finger family protein [Candidatus Binatia bacterium]
MTLQHPFILNVLQHVSTDRLQKAVNALVDGSMTITITRHTESEIRALVKNGTGPEYGLTLTPSLATCSCKDALYRGCLCKHVVMVALSVLRSPQEEQQPHRTIHLVKQLGMALCGADNPAHFWQWPYWPETLWKESCADCEAIRKRPVLRTTIATA